MGVELRTGGLDRDLVDRLDEEIHAFNVEQTGMDDGRPLTIRIVHDGDLIGGLSGWTWGECGRVEYLWLADSYRGQGLGTRVMDVAEQEMVARGCRQVVVSTHTFQAPGFYLRRGYVEIARIEGWPRGHAEISMVKQLGPLSPAMQDIAASSR